MNLRKHRANTDLHFMMTLVVITVVLTACALRHIGGSAKTDPHSSQGQSQTNEDAYWGPKNTRGVDPSYDRSAENHLSVFHLLD
jgi:hypothetical protein